MELIIRRRHRSSSRLWVSVRPALEILIKTDMIVAMAATVIYHPTLFGFELPWFVIRKVADDEISIFITRPGREPIQIGTEERYSWTRRGVYGDIQVIGRMPQRPFRSEEMLVMHGKLEKEK